MKFPFRRIPFAAAVAFALTALTPGLRAQDSVTMGGASPALTASAPLVREVVDWPAFLARHDLVWEQLPLQWNEGAFAGNGNLGFMAYATLADNRFDFHLARADVTDHRKAPDRATSLGVPGANVMWDFPRLDIGRMVLRPAGKIQDGRLRMDLWNAELTGLVTTDLGELRIRAITLRDRMVHVFEVVSTEKGADGAPAAWRWEFIPGNPTSPRALTKPDDAKKRNYETNPNPRLERIDGLPVCVQPLLAGGDYATTWHEVPAPNAARASRLYVSTANAVPASGQSGPRAVADVKTAASSFDAELTAHRAWWQAYHRKAFLSIPDARLESFYWIQMYKLACCLRPDGPALDVLGPFYRTTPWPGIWWNLNIQLSYWPVYAGNRLELGENYTALLDARFDELQQGLARYSGGKSFGDFVWALHNYWWQLRFAGDWSAVNQRWTPKAKAALAEFEKLTQPREGGRLGLAPMGSPEYQGFQPFPDTTYNLALLRWLLSSLAEADSHTGRAPDPDAAHWRDLQEKLIPYPVDDTGLRIASNQALEESHRHYSHLLPLYPLYQLDPDAAADRELVLKSVRHWHQLQGGKSLAGYSFTGGASLYASLGLGDDALGMLTQFLTGKIGISQLHANTFYTEAGGKNPVIETPLSAASATMDLLLQSWRGKIRVFPGVPAAWSEASFRDLRAQGGFLVGAAREKGGTAWVSVTSEAGEPCVVLVADWSGPVEARGDRAYVVETIAPGEYRIDLRKGETVLLVPSGRTTSAIVRALPVAENSTNPYGVKRGGELKSAQFYVEPPPPVLVPAP